VVSHPDRPQANHAHLTVLQYYNMHADITQENKERNTIPQTRNVLSYIMTDVEDLMGRF